MQKVINVLAVLSFTGTAAIVGGCGFVYLNRNAIVEDMKSKVAAAVTATVTEALPGMLDAAMPEIPEMPAATGPALPF